MEYKFTNANFKQEVLESSVPVMVDFYAEWCGPCRMMGPVVEKLAGEYEGRAKIGKVNSDEEEELAGQYNVMSIPDILFFKNGKVVDQVVGAVPESVLKRQGCRPGRRRCPRVRPQRKTRRPALITRRIVPNEFSLFGTKRPPGQTGRPFSITITSYHFSTLLRKSCSLGFLGCAKNSSGAFSS